MSATSVRARLPPHLYRLVSSAARGAAASAARGAAGLRLAVVLFCDVNDTCGVRSVSPADLSRRGVSPASRSVFLLT